MSDWHRRLRRNGRKQCYARRRPPKPRPVASAIRPERNRTDGCIRRFSLREMPRASKPGRSSRPHQKPRRTPSPRRSCTAAPSPGPSCGREDAWSRREYSVRGEARMPTSGVKNTLATSPANSASRYGTPGNFMAAHLAGDDDVVHDASADGKERDQSEEHPVDPIHPTGRLLDQGVHKRCQPHDQAGPGRRGSAVRPTR